MFNEDNTTFIKIRKGTRMELEKLALNGETYDEVIGKLIAVYKSHQAPPRTS